MIRQIIQKFLFLALIVTGCSASAELYPFEPNIVELEGFLTREERYGPPNFGESPATDQRVLIFVLKLKNPITVGTESSLSEINDEIVMGITDIQVVFDKNSKFDIPDVNANVKLKGILSKQISSHDFYQVVLRVR